MPTETKEQFEQRYAKNSGMTVAELNRWGLYPESCDCRDPECTGWQMGRPWEDAIVEDQLRTKHAEATPSHSGEQS